MTETEDDSDSDSDDDEDDVHVTIGDIKTGAPQYGWVPGHSGAMAGAAWAVRGESAGSDGIVKMPLS